MESISAQQAVFNMGKNDRSVVRYVTLTFEISVALVFKLKAGKQLIIKK